MRVQGADWIGWGVAGLELCSQARWGTGPGAGQHWLKHVCSCAYKRVLGAWDRLRAGATGLQAKVSGDSQESAGSCVAALRASRRKKYGASLPLSSHCCLQFCPAHTIPHAITHPSFPSSLQYVNNQTLADVTFVVEGRKFYAHRIALLASSDAFRAMFNGGYREKEASSIEIPNIPWDVFECMMHYIYTGVKGPRAGVKQGYSACYE